MRNAVIEGKALNASERGRVLVRSGERITICYWKILSSPVTL